MRTVKNISYLITLVMISTTVFAQSQELSKAEKQERMMARKVAIITQRLNLSVKEAQNFWPVFNEFEAKREEINIKRREAFEKSKDTTSTLSDTELTKLADTYIKYDKEDADLKSEYHSKFKEILPIKKVIELYATEHHFKRELLRDIRGQGRSHGEPKRPARVE